MKTRDGRFNVEHKTFGSHYQLSHQHAVVPFTCTGKIRQMEIYVRTSIQFDRLTYR